MSESTRDAAAELPAAELRNVNLVFRDPQRGGSRILVLDDVSLRVAETEFVAVVGPSGCGKTTILHLLAGLLKPTTGEVLRNGADVRGTSRDTGYMLARASLSPWRTARKNVELGLEIRGVKREERRKTSSSLLTRLGLIGFADHYPHQLSQGMRQRVAVARTLAIDPAILLMDEPFGALDAQTKLIVQDEFLTLWDDSHKTVVLVTHDLEEALLLADRVIVLTARPAAVKVDMRVRFPRPRRIDELRFEPEFQQRLHELWEALHDELR